MNDNRLIKAGARCTGFGQEMLSVSSKFLQRALDIREHKRYHFLIICPVLSAISFIAGSLALLMGGLVWTGGQTMKGIQSFFDSCVRLTHKKEAAATTG